MDEAPSRFRGYGDRLPRARCMRFVGKVLGKHRTLIGLHRLDDFGAYVETSKQCGFRTIAGTMMYVSSMVPYLRTTRLGGLGMVLEGQDKPL